MEPSIGWQKITDAQSFLCETCLIFLIITFPKTASLPCEFKNRAKSTKWARTSSGWFLTRFNHLKIWFQTFFILVVGPINAFLFWRYGKVDLFWRWSTEVSWGTDIRNHRNNMESDEFSRVYTGTVGKTITKSSLSRNEKYPNERIAQYLSYKRQTNSNMMNDVVLLWPWTRERQWLWSRLSKL